MSTNIVTTKRINYKNSGTFYFVSNCFIHSKGKDKGVLFFHVTKKSFWFCFLWVSVFLVRILLFVSFFLHPTTRPLMTYFSNFPSIFSLVFRYRTMFSLIILWIEWHLGFGSFLLVVLMHIYFYFYYLFIVFGGLLFILSISFANYILSAFSLIFTAARPRSHMLVLRILKNVWVVFFCFSRSFFY